MSPFIKGQHFFSKTDLSHLFHPELISLIDGITILVEEACLQNMKQNQYDKL